MKSILPALLLIPALALADVPADYANVAPITADATTPFHRIALPAEVYRVLTQSDLRDLRVFNGTGEVVPHALEPRPSATLEKAATVAVPLFALPKAASDGSALSVQVEKRGDGTIVSVMRDAPPTQASAPDAYLLDASLLKRAVSALELVPADASAQFVGAMRVEASDDLERWRTLAASAPLLVTLANGQSLSRLRIEWPATEAKYWRASWVGGSSTQPAVRFAKATLEPAASRQEPARIWQPVEPMRLQLNDGEYAYDLPIGAPIDRLRLLLPQLNSVVPMTLLTRSRSEDPWHAIGSFTVYRLQQDGVEFSSPDLAASPARQLLLRVDNRGGGLGSGAPGSRDRLDSAPPGIRSARRGTVPPGLRQCAGKGSGLPDHQSGARLRRRQQRRGAQADRRRHPGQRDDRRRRSPTSTAARYQALGAVGRAAGRGVAAGRNGPPPLATVGIGRG